MKHIAWPCIVSACCFFIASALMGEVDPLTGSGAPASAPAAATTKPGASQPSTASMPSGGTVAGTVVREMAGKGVANAKVELLDARRKSIATTRSDAKGFFLLENVPVGDGYSVKAFDGSQRAGAEGWKKGVSVKEGIQTDVGAITVHALPG